MQKLDKNEKMGLKNQKFYFKNQKIQKLDKIQKFNKN